MDAADPERKAGTVVRPGGVRQQLIETLHVAFGAQLLSEKTFADRLELVRSSTVIDTAAVVGDLTTRAARSGMHPATASTIQSMYGDLLSAEQDGERSEPVMLLALDWSGAHQELVIGRSPTSDAVLSGPKVSRRHARLRFRDGGWLLEDLDSTNGTIVNGAFVSSCALHPGDRLVIGDHHLTVD
jgi:FHA domain